MTLASITALAQEAKDLANAVKGEFDGHERLCAERYLGIHKTMGLILKVISWGGAVVVAAMISVLGWSLSQQNEDRKLQIQTLNSEIQAFHDRAPPAR